MGHRRLQISREPVSLIFLAGFAYALAAAEVFAAIITDSRGLSLHFTMALAAILFGWMLTARAIWFAFADGVQVLLVSSLAIYWLLALLGLLFMAVSADPMPFMSTLVSALISLMVAWLVGNILKAPRLPRSKRGWWRIRL